MAVTISRLYDRYADAERAVTALESAGIPIQTSASSRIIPMNGIAARKIET